MAQLKPLSLSLTHTHTHTHTLTHTTAPWHPRKTFSDSLWSESILVTHLIQHMALRFSGDVFILPYETQALLDRAASYLCLLPCKVTPNNLREESKMEGGRKRGSSVPRKYADMYYGGGSMVVVWLQKAVKPTIYCDTPQSRSPQQQQWNEPPGRFCLWSRTWMQGSNRKRVQSASLVHLSFSCLWQR